MLKSLIFGIFAAGICVVTAGVASGVPPQQVSPAGLVELRCPTFSWSAVSGAAGYELLVYEVVAGDVGTEPLLSVRLPGGAAAWTPPGASCLAAGGRYAWTLRVLGKDGEGGWAESVLFEVAAAPSMGEVEAALATLRRYLREEQGGRSPVAETGTVEASEGETARPGEAVAERSREAAASREAGQGPRSVAANAVPSLGSPSLTVDSNVALGAASNLFKDGSVFLWDDTSGNTALGRLALSSAMGAATGNTAVGREALHFTVPGAVTESSYNTAVGDQVLRSNTTGMGNTASGRLALFSNTTGFLNTASGNLALYSNTTGHRNTASGYRALYSNDTGYRNTASGYRALYSNNTGSYNTANGYSSLESNTTGSRNTAVGRSAGLNATTGDDNIFLGSGASGEEEDTHTIRIGGVTGVGLGEQSRTFIAGIQGVLTGDTNRVNVLIDSNGQLGTVSSSREVKQDLREVGELSRRLLDLRPVAFRYKVHAAADPQTPLQFGLIAEEVAEVFPELVVRDGEGRPVTVKYHLLAALLLNELQRAERGLIEAERGLVQAERELSEQRAELIQAEREREDQRTELLALRDRLTAVEQGHPPERSAVPWWRRLGGGGRDAP